MRQFLYRLSRLNPALLAPMLLLTALGAVFIMSAGSARQEIFHEAWLAHLSAAAVGMAVYLALALFDYRKALDWFALPAYALSLVLLVAVLFLGTSHLGGRRWLFFFQPSEVAKFALIVALAAVFGGPARRDAQRAGTLKRRCGLKWFAVGIALVAVPAALILEEPDLGTAMVLVPTGLAMLFSARVCNRALVTMLAVAAIAAGAVLWTVSAAERAPTPERRAELLARTRLRPHQIKRLQVFLNPDSDIHGAGYNLRQARIAVGSGGLWGRGWKKGAQYRLGYLPASVSMNDFIFAVLAEEAGFAGTVSMLVLYGVLICAGLWTGFECADDRGRLIAIGVTMLIFCHVYVNVAMSIGLMPITGLPLPFISSGKTFMVTLMALLGVLQSVSVYGARKEAM